VLRERLRALHDEFGHVPYTHNLFALFSVVYPSLCPARDAFARADRLAHFVGHVLHRAREDAPIGDSEHRLFCSEWVGTVFARLGLAKPEFDAHFAAPVTPLLRPEGFAEPVYLEVADGGDAAR
jgi:hypothetical protein